MREKDSVGSEKLVDGAAGRAAHDGWTLGLLNAAKCPGADVVATSCNVWSDGRGEANWGISAWRLPPSGSSSWSNPAPAVWN
jgi:hypothetical protein